MSRAYHETYRSDGSAGQLHIVPKPEWHEGSYDFDQEKVAARPSRWVGVVALLAVGVIVTGIMAAVICALHAIDWIIQLF